MVFCIERIIMVKGKKGNDGSDDSYGRVDRTKNRSDAYQFVLLEQPCSPEMMTEVADAKGMGAMLNPFGYNEEILDLQDQLKAAFWRLVDMGLTKRQAEVVRLYSQGKTQTEIAKLLSVNQSSITKSLNGNTSYEQHDKRSYGGSIKKLRKLAMKDDEILEIIDKISDLS